MTGLVSSESGEGLAGANVILEGTSYGTAANISGEYNITNVPEGTYIWRAIYKELENDGRKIHTGYVNVIR